MKVLIAQTNPTVGDVEGNTKKVLDGIACARKKGADLALFSELCLSGYPPDDFLLLPSYAEAINKAVERICKETKGLIAVIGTIRHTEKDAERPVYNSAAVIQDTSLLGYYDKALLPTYDVFDERRYFEPGSQTKVWNFLNQKVAITICEDIWQHCQSIVYRYDPLEKLNEQKPDLLLNLSASPYSWGKVQRRVDVGIKTAQTLNCPVILCNQVGGNDSLIFDGHSYFLNREGKLVAIAKGFEEDFVLIDTVKSAPSSIKISCSIEELYRALVLGVRDYFRKQGFSKACLGLSGGIDSALVACIACEALGKENVLGVSMPSRYSSEGSKKDADQLVQALGIAYKIIPIEEPFQSYLNLLEPHFENHPQDSTEENIQARIRGMVLMALSNKLDYIVLSTGNKSEMAMGYATLYGDMCGGLGVINDLTKNQVYAISNWINRDKEIIPWNTIHKPPSAELKLNQKDTDSLPEYSIIDNVLQAYIAEHSSPEEIAKQFGYSLDLVKDLVRRIHRNEYKRRQSPPGLRVSEKAFSVGRRFPIVQKWVP